MTPASSRRHEAPRRTRSAFLYKSFFVIFVFLRAFVMKANSALGERKDDVDGGTKIDRTAVALRRLEFHLLRRTGGRFVQAMPETAHDAQNSHLTRRAELDFQQHFAFELQGARFIRVSRCRLEQDFNRSVDSLWRGRLRSGLLWRRLGVEPARADVAVRGRRR